MYKKGDLVMSRGEYWSEKYSHKIFMVLDFFESTENGNKWLLLDHIGGGTLLAFEDELEAIST